MKANELRLGNYVYTETMEEPFELTEITDVEDQSHRYHKSIKLTEKWFKYFNFRISKNYCSIDLDSELRLLIVKKTGSMILQNYFSGDEVSLPTALESVHQLQNLYFTLTGEELKI